MRRRPGAALYFIPQTSVVPFPRQINLNESALIFALKERQQWWWRRKGAESNRPLSATTIASANTYLINIWPEDTLPVTKKQPFSHSNEEAIKEEKQQPLPQRDTRVKEWDCVYQWQRGVHCSRFACRMSLISCKITKCLMLYILLPTRY